jgi:hypothetical protein
LRWQRLPSASNSGWASGITAIELAPPAAGLPKATLFVVKSSARFNVPTGPATTTRLALTGRFKATAWQRQELNLLFVLVVEADRHEDLESYLRLGPQA